LGREYPSPGWLSFFVYIQMADYLLIALADRKLAPVLSCSQMGNLVTEDLPKHICMQVKAFEEVTERMA
jgi:hypothetical protein